MYTKTKFSGLALTFALLFGVLTIASPQNIYAANLYAESSAKVEFNVGELSLAQVATFDFGKQDITTTTSNYNATNVGNPIQVSDLRGNGKGWNLGLSLSNFTHTDNSDELSGAFITLSGTQIAGVNGTTGAAPTSPSTTSITLDADETENSIFSAEANTGMGIWGITTELSDAQLTVPAGAIFAGIYQADLTWTLQSTP